MTSPREVNQEIEELVLGQAKVDTITVTRLVDAIQSLAAGEEALRLASAMDNEREKILASSRAAGHIEDARNLIEKWLPKELRIASQEIIFSIEAADNERKAGIFRAAATDLEIGTTKLRTTIVMDVLGLRGTAGRINEAIDTQIKFTQDPALRERIINEMSALTPRQTNNISDLIGRLRDIAEFACTTHPEQDGDAALEEIRGLRPTEVDPACLSIAELEWLLVRWHDRNWNEAIDFYRAELFDKAELRKTRGDPI